MKLVYLSIVFIAIGTIVAIWVSLEYGIKILISVTVGILLTTFLRFAKRNKDLFDNKRSDNDSSP